MINWKKGCKLLRAELQIERARTEATKDALRMMIQELAAALNGTIELVDAGWEDDRERN